MLIGNKHLHFEQVSSTNDIAWQHAGDESHKGLIVTADEQLAGRGRRGNTWISPPESALYLSMLLHPQLELQRPVKLTIWAGLGVCRVVERTLGIKPQLKWPNDVLIQGKKVCGILVEQKQDWFVVGVGLNIQVPVQNFQSAGVTQAASLRDFTDQAINRTELLQLLMSEWNQLHEVESDQLIELWRYYNGLIGQQVRLEVQGQERIGKLQSLGWDEITLQSEGELHRFQPEAVTKLRVE